MARSSLPQPPSEAGGHAYKYIAFDCFETDWLGNPGRLQSVIQTETCPMINDDPRYAPGTLVWVLQTKGKQKQSGTSKLSNALALHKKRLDKTNARNNTDAASSPDVNVDNDASLNPTTTSAGGTDDNQSDYCSKPNIGGTRTLNQSRSQFFLRARVVSDNENDVGKRLDRRILVRYSKGATYRVKANNLIPILEPSMHNIGGQQTKTDTVVSLPPMVVIAPETNIYRHFAKVHTTPDDSFMEIGCDYGITVNKVQTSLDDAGDVPRVWSENETTDGGMENDSLVTVERKGEDAAGSDRAACIGVDKSFESINIAKERYPKSMFIIGDALVETQMAAMRKVCEQSLLGSAPSVICIDINGNRKISEVLECIQRVMNEPWKRQPRMIIVKSRLLYWELKDCNNN